VPGRDMSRLRCDRGHCLPRGDWRFRRPRSGRTAIALSAAVAGSRAGRLHCGCYSEAASPPVHLLSRVGLPAGQGSATGIATKLACGGAIRHGSSEGGSSSRPEERDAVQSGGSLHRRHRGDDADIFRYNMLPWLTSEQSQAGDTIGGYDRAFRQA
jgi:hypothetical protein